MATERVTETTDGMTTERVTERSEPTVVNTAPAERGGGSGGTIVFALIGLVLVAIVGYFLLQMSRNDAAETESVSSAASSVADSAQSAAEGVSEAAGRAADAVDPNN